MICAVPIHLGITTPVKATLPSIRIINEPPCVHQYTLTASSESLHAAVVAPSVPCHLNLTGPEGYIEAPPQSVSAFHSTVDCSYIIFVYMGYGVEVQVRI